MSTENADTTTFKQGKASQEANPYKSPLVEEPHPQLETNKRETLQLDSLQDLSKEQLDLLLDQKEKVQSEITRSFAETAIPPGIYKDNGHIYWVCPEDLFTEDNIIGQMIASFSIMVGARLKTVRTPITTTPLLDKKFITGLWFGMESSTNQKRRRGKQSYELGRTCVFALIVKNVFEQTPELTGRALAKDQFFFGNNEGEVFNKSKVSFHIKTSLRTFFNDQRWGDLIFGIINQTAQSVGFTYLTEAEQDKVIADHLLPVDQLINNCYPSVSLKRGKQVIQQSRKPNAIRSSPLYTKEEMEILSACTSSVFTEFVDLVKDYEQTVFSVGFQELESRIREIINIRWETLQRFANRTKIRLQAIRPIVNNPTLKKANVTQDQVRSFLERCTDPVGDLVRDIKHILGRVNLKDSLSVAFKKDFTTNEMAVQYLYVKCTEMYKVHFSNIPAMAKLTSRQMEVEPEELDFELAVKSLTQVQNSFGSLRGQISNFRNIKYFKVFGRTKQILDILQNLKDKLKLVLNIPNRSSDIAIRLLTNGQYMSCQQYVNDIVNKTSGTLAYLKRSSEARVAQKEDPQILSLLSTFLIEIEKSIVQMDSLVLVK